MKKVGVIGHFGGKEEFLDGQTVKTKVLYKELVNTKAFDVSCVDIYYQKKNPFKLIKDTLKCLIRCKTIFVLLSGRGMKLYFPILYYWGKLFKKNVIHDVIGGNLSAYVKKYPAFKKYLNSFSSNLVELQSMADELGELGVTNAEAFPNFKRLNYLSESDIKAHSGDVYRFCTFSRVMKEKGIEDAINAVEKINRERGRKVCELDIYGVVDSGYTQRFEEIMANASDAICYKGCVPFDQSVDVIKDYYALLFPTFWCGEGFAGTIIDAYASAVPVIATDWNMNAEIIKHMSTGIIYKESGSVALATEIEWAVDNCDKMFEMKKNCIKEYENYDADKLMEKLIKKI